MKRRYFLHCDDGSGRVIELAGREVWALQHLLAAGNTGCTPIDKPGPRWSHYVWKLRGRGIAIETITEPHGPPFAGTHARYVLTSRIKPMLPLPEVV